MFSMQRQLSKAALVTASYVGNQGHHLLVLVPTNAGNPALCLSLSQPGEVGPGSATCGPFGEDARYISASGQVYQGTRSGLGPNFGSMTAQKTVGNSNYNALEANLRLITGSRGTLLAGYTFSKSIDDASNPGEGWSVSGTARFSTRFPVTLFDDSDRSLLGTLGNGVNNQLLDTPEYVGGPLAINTNPRGGKPTFRAAAFAGEALGQPGDADRRFFHGPGIEDFDVELNNLIRRCG
jgi:hypothetical protein